MINLTKPTVLQSNKLSKGKTVVTQLEELKASLGIQDTTQGWMWNGKHYICESLEEFLDGIVDDLFLINPEGEYRLQRAIALGIVPTAE